jgi:hypothetical protein
VEPYSDHVTCPSDQLLAGGVEMKDTIVVIEEKDGLGNRF